jgi:hypothetical protein
MDTAVINKNGILFIRLKYLQRLFKSLFLLLNKNEVTVDKLNFMFEKLGDYIAMRYYQDD